MFDVNMFSMLLTAMIDFMESDCLSISEVKALLETLTKTRLMNGIKMNDTSVYKKTQEYVGNFARFTTQESISAVRE